MESQPQNPEFRINLKTFTHVLLEFEVYCFRHGLVNTVFFLQLKNATLFHLDYILTHVHVNILQGSIISII